LTAATPSQAQNDIGTRTGIGGYFYQVAPLYRYYAPATQDHYYTTNFYELGWGSYGYYYEGVQCQIFASWQGIGTPLYQYYNPYIGAHFYTTNFYELGWGNGGYYYQGVQGYVMTYSPSRYWVPLYRYYSPYNYHHFYTDNWYELGWGNAGYY